MDPTAQQRPPRRVLITGIANEIASAFAARLEADESVEEVVGVDLREPSAPLVRTDFVRADLRNPLVGRLLDAKRIDTVVHLALTAAPVRAGGRARMKELNVIGTMQLLAAAQKSSFLERFVVRSTTAVYGSNYADPALFREDAALGGAPRAGYAKDAVEVEGYARGFARRRDDVAVTILRFANFIGPTVDTPLTRYLSLAAVPTVLGYDPRVQLCHEEDALEVLGRTVAARYAGTFNVASRGIVYLSQAIRLAGKPSVPIPLPFVNTTAAVMRRTARVDFSPEQLSFLLYGRVGDIARLRSVLGYEPRYTTRQALVDFLRARRISALIDRDTVERWEHDLVDRLRRTRGGATPASTA